MIMEKLISKWHASVGLAVQQMGIVRVTLIQPGKLTALSLQLRSCGQWSELETVFSISVLHGADKERWFFFKAREKEWKEITPGRYYTTRVWDKREVRSSP